MVSSDSELIAACQRGDADAWQALVLRYERLIYTIPIRAGLDEQTAAEVFQHVFVMLYQSLAGISQPDRIRSWLVTTAKRETLRLVRKQAAAPVQVSTEDAAAQEMPTDLPLPADIMQGLEEQHMVRVAMQQLGERCRQMLTLLYYQEPPLAYADIAATLDIPVGSVGPYRARCLEQLRVRLMEMEF
jgi:RNA polymerase sigma factor (sigma-70 family)